MLSYVCIRLNYTALYVIYSVNQFRNVCTYIRKFSSKSQIQIPKVRNATTEIPMNKKRGGDAAEMRRKRRQAINAGVRS